MRPATRERIRELAAEMGYVPDRHRRGPKIGRTMTILADVPGSRTISSLRSASIGELLVGATQAALESGYQLTVASRANPEPRRPPRLDGLLVIDPEPDHALPAGTPFVTAGQVEGSDHRGPSVYPDHEAAIVEVLDHLRAAGFERPGLLIPGQGSSFWLSSQRAYRAWSAGAGVPACVEYVDGPPDVAGGREAAGRLLARDPAPDALVAASELLAEGAVVAIRDAGLGLPGDVGLASLGDSERLRTAPVPVTALDLRTGEVGRRAVELLIAVLESGSAAPEPRRMVESALVVRASTSAG